MARLVGFRLNRNFPLSPSFYCLDCMEALSREKGWHWKDGRSRKGAAPIIAHGDGLVTYLKGSASSMRLQMKDGEWVMRDEKLNEAEEASLSFYMSSLGLRAFAGVTVGLMGSLVGIHWSLALSATALLAITIGLLGFTLGRSTKPSESD